MTWIANSIDKRNRQLRELAFAFLDQHTTLGGKVAAASLNEPYRAFMLAHGFGPDSAALKYALRVRNVRRSTVAGITTLIGVSLRP